MRHLRRQDGTRVLQPLPIGKLRCGDDFFRCIPYSATITVRACVKRQKSVAMNEHRSRKERLQGVGLNKDSRCNACPIGQAIAKRFGVLAAVTPGKVKRRSKRRRQRA